MFVKLGLTEVTSKQSLEEVRELAMKTFNRKLFEADGPHWGLALPKVAGRPG